MIEIKLNKRIMKPEFPEIVDCPYCGNRTPHQMVGQHTVPVVVPGGTDVVEGEFRQPFMLVCQTCQQVSIYEKRWTEYVVESEGARLHILYPLASVAPPEAPAKVGERFKEAMEVQKRSPPLCAVGLGRTLEAIMRD